MSTQGPHDPSDVEYLPEDEAARPRTGGGRKRTAVVAGAAAVVVLGAAGAYGVMQFMSSGDSAATAVPDHALGYVSLDLDPSGGQKVAAYQTMRKFPALKEQLGLSSDDDPRRWVVDAINNSSGCDIDFEDDVKSWLGNKVAFSAVKGEEEPEPFFVLEVTDADAAEKGVATLFECGGEEEHGTAMVGDFMVVAPDASLAEDIATDAAESSLADDEDFGDRMDEAGDQGIVTGYLAPAAVDLMFDEAEQAEGSSGNSGGDSSELMQDDLMPVEMGAARDYLEDFEGAAMQVRFADEGVEMEVVAAGIDQIEDLEAGDSGMTDLPSTTALAYGFGVGDGAVDMMEDSIKGQMSDSEFESGVQEFEAETGLSFPEDVETLLGDGLSLAVDGSVDIEQLGQAFMGLGPVADLALPVGLRIVTDEPAEVIEVTDKLRGLIPSVGPVQVEVEEGEGAVAIGLDADYVAQLAGDGDLGDSAPFQDAVPDADDSLGGLFIDFDADNWLDELVGEEDPDARANVEPLSSLGMSASTDDDTGRMVLRLTTD